MNLEFGLFAIPKLDITILLKTSPELSQKLSGTSKDKEKQKRTTSYLGKKKSDIHEKDKQHLMGALDSYLQFAKEYPRYMKVIDCLQGEKMFPPQEIHQKVVTLIQKLIKN